MRNSFTTICLSSGLFYFSVSPVLIGLVHGVGEEAYEAKELVEQIATHSFNESNKKSSISRGK